MVVYNNLLSIPMIAVLIFVTGEAWRLDQEVALKHWGFQLAAAASAVIGFWISVASMWFLSCTTATTFSLVGSLNKIPLAVLGMLLFKAPTSLNNVVSVMIGLAAGVVFAHAKSQSAVGGGGQAHSQGTSGGGGGGFSRQGSVPLPRHGRAYEAEPSIGSQEQDALLGK